MLSYLQRAHEYQVPLREPQTEEDMPEALEAERAAEQAIIDNGACSSRLRGPSLTFRAAEPLTEEEVARKEELPPWL